MNRYFIISLPNGDTIFTKYHKWNEVTRILPYLGRHKGITINEVNFWNFYKKLLTNRSKYDIINTEIKKRGNEKMKYRLIDDALCELNEDIPCYENCEDCEYFLDCMEEYEDETDN